MRFGDLVRSAGRPQTVTLWTGPKKDRSFNQARRQNRVLTVVQKPTTKHKDFGIIGFHEEPHAPYLVFPRPLPKDQDSRVVGINYQLLDEPVVADTGRPADLKPKKPPAKPKAVEKAFTVKVRRTASSTTPNEHTPNIPPLDLLGVIPLHQYWWN